MQPAQYIQLFFLSCLLLMAGGAAAQQPENGFPDVEKLQVFTDRNLYIAGERVSFSAFVLPGTGQPVLSGSVLYAEIISPEVEQLTGGKFHLGAEGAFGSLVLPEDATTGYYYLRVYTRYMRNAGPHAYSYVLMKVINPVRTEFREGRDTLTAAREPAGATGLFRIDLDRIKPVAGDTAEVWVTAIDPRAVDLAGITLSVVRGRGRDLPASILEVKSRAVKDPLFYPETRGLSISGSVITLAGRETQSQVRVNLSIIGDGRDFMAVRTDPDGRFFFALPDYFGSRDLFLCAEHTDTPLELLVDNDFCARPLPLPSPVFELSDAERELALEMARNVQVQRAFSDPGKKDRPGGLTDTIAFYGSPTNVIYLDNYVELPSLEEYFNELPAQVRVRRRKGQPYFKVIGTHEDMLVYDPLVIVDWVAIDDPAEVLKASPRNIARIEVVNMPYIKGDNVYGGIVHLISRQGDFAGIDLPGSGIFIDYRFFSDAAPVTLQMPDAGNTLLWKPRLDKVEREGSALPFYVPDTPGQYVVTLKGVFPDGKVYRQHVEFEVK